MSAARRTLAERLEQARRENYLDLRATTPAFEGLFVRCRGMTKPELTAALDRETDTDEDTIDALVSTCIGIWEEVDGRGVSPIDGFDGVIDLATMELTGKLPTFSTPELSAAFGIKDGTAGANVRALLTPQDGPRLGMYADALLNFSTGMDQEIVRTARGN